jgi:uncharacterized membrane protein (GlpM family)
MAFVYRFVLGGLIVSLFALSGDVLRPKGFAGLFGAAPSVALATLTLTLLNDGKPYAALESRSMLAGSFAFLCYAMACVYLLSQRHTKVVVAVIGMLPAWGVCALLLWMLFLR